MNDEHIHALVTVIDRERLEDLAARGRCSRSAAIRIALQRLENATDDELRQAASALPDGRRRREVSATST